MNKDQKKVVNVSVKKEVVIHKPKVEDFDTSKSLEEHLEENRANVKTKIDIKTILTYVIMIIIVVACVLLLVHFCEKSIADLNKKTTTTTNMFYPTDSSTTVSTKGVEYVRPTTIATAATHTAFPSKPAKNPPNVTISGATTRTTRTKPTTTTESTTTATETTEDATTTTEQIGDN